MRLICKISGFDMVIKIIDNLLENLSELSEQSDEWNEGFTAFGNAMKNALLKLQEGDNE